MYVEVVQEQKKEFTEKLLNSSQVRSLGDSVVQGSLLTATVRRGGLTSGKLSEARTGPCTKDLRLFLNTVILSFSIVINFFLVTRILFFCIESRRKWTHFSLLRFTRQMLVALN